MKKQTQELLQELFSLRTLFRVLFICGLPFALLFLLVYGTTLVENIGRVPITETLAHAGLFFLAALSFLGGIIFFWRMKKNQAPEKFPRWLAWIISIGTFVFGITIIALDWQHGVGILKLITNPFSTGMISCGIIILILLSKRHKKKLRRHS